MNRRFLRTAAGILVGAPAIVRASSIMPVVAPKPIAWTEGIGFFDESRFALDGKSWPVGIIRTWRADDFTGVARIVRETPVYDWSALDGMVNEWRLRVHLREVEKDRQPEVVPYWRDPPTSA